MEKNKVGRPEVITEEVIRQLDTAFSWGCSDLEACLHANISKTALYDYQKDHPEFTERKELLKGNPVLQARASVVKKIQWDADLALKFLERKKKDEFSLKQEVAIETSEPIRIQIEKIDNEKDETK